MSTDLITFESPEFGQVRTVGVNGEPWFVGKDVAEALGYKNTKDALLRHVDPEDKRGSRFTTPSGEQTVTIINESVLYTLVLSSKLSTAKKFRRWVTSEIIPSIRKTGGYISGQETMTDSELMAKALLVAQRQIEERNKQIAAMQPKALFADAVSASDDCILIRDMAKLLCQNGIDIGEKRLFAWLRNNGYLTLTNAPTQRASDMGLFMTDERVVGNPKGKYHLVSTTKVTGKGQQYFISKFLSC